MTSAATCATCGEGQYSDANDASACKVCAVGKYEDEAGVTVGCKSFYCIEGQTHKALTGLTTPVGSCDACAQGKWKALKTQTTGADNKIYQKGVPSATCAVKTGGTNANCAAASASSTACIAASPVTGTCAVKAGGTNTDCAAATANKAACETTATAAGNGGVTANDCVFTADTANKCEFTAAGDSKCTIDLTVNCPIGHQPKGCGFLAPWHLIDNFHKNSADYCTPCATGKYSAETAAQVCKTCPLGKYAAVTGTKTDCTTHSDCTDLGKYKVLNSAKNTVATDCATCAVGKFNAFYHKGACDDTITTCADGTMSAGWNAVTHTWTCTACGAGKYQTKAGHDAAIA